MDNILEFVKITIPAILLVLSGGFALIKYFQRQLDKALSSERKVAEVILKNETDRREEAEERADEAKKIVENNQRQIGDLRVSLAEATVKLNAIPLLEKRMTDLEEKVQRQDSVISELTRKNDQLANDNSRLVSENDSLRKQVIKSGHTIEAYEKAFSLMNREQPSE